MTGPPPVALGSMLFTLVEPRPGHARAYNRWYERDHFYAGVMVGPHTLAGRRFVATRREKALRLPDASPQLPRDRGSYLALYWVQAGRHDAWNAWAVEQVNRLHAQGRMFEARDHVHTVLAGFDWAVARDEDGVPPELALDHPFPGLVAVLGEPAPGTPRAALDAWLREEQLPAVLAGSPAALCLSFTTLPLLGDAPADVPRAATDAFVHLYFLDADPCEGFDERFRAHGAALEASGLARMRWASPFVPTLPGTDAYVDAL